MLPISRKHPLFIRIRIVSGIELFVSESYQGLSYSYQNRIHRVRSEQLIDKAVHKCCHYNFNNQKSLNSGRQPTEDESVKKDWKSDDA